MTIYKACSEAAVTTFFINDQFYQVDSGVMNIMFSDWSVDVPGCGSFTYTATNSLGLPLDASVITYNSGTRTFSV